MIPFAGLAPDLRAVRGAGAFGDFDVARAVGLGLELRRACRRATSTEEVATALVEHVNGFDHDGRPASVLVRAFVTCTVAELPEDALAALRRAAPDAPLDPGDACLRLVASRGLEPDWNDVALSRGHRAVLLDGAGSSPMVAEIGGRLRLGDPERPRVASFLVPDPRESAAVPAKQFVASYDVQAVFGFGTTPWGGRTMVLIAFVRAPITAAAARLFETVAHYLSLAWLGTAELRAALGDAAGRARTDALEDLVTAHERHLEETQRDAHRRIEGARLDAQRDARAAAEAAESHANKLHRTQRAMLNLVEDLRDARESLTATVEVRTRDLAAANQKLAARNQELEEFVYIASHDLQEPLRTVAGYLQMVQRRYGANLGPEADEFIRFAIEGALRMQALIESLLLYSRVTSSERVFEPTPLDEALDVALRNLALRLEQTQATVERAPLPTVRADRTQMVQVFQNLLSNALKFSGPKPPRVHVASQVVDGVCTVTVRDEGIGFNPRFAGRIFKIFRRLRRDTEGTGIGLAVCKKIAERHGGGIRAEGKPGEGATFILTLPAEAPPGP